MSNLKLIDKKIDEIWHSGLINNKNHMFFSNMDNVNNMLNNFRKMLKESYKIKDDNNYEDENNCNNIIYPKIREIKDKKIIYKNKLLKKDIINFINLLDNNHSREFIEEKIYKIKNKILPSNINLDNYLKSIKNNGKKKILIIGSGPNGLFNTLYLHYLYNNNIDILLLDNRIVKEGYREPFIRDRFFAYESHLLTILYKQLYCSNNYDGGSINYIEYLGYFQILKNKIPIYFTKKYDKWNNIKKLMKNYNFEIIFDCSGNRLDVPIIKVNDKKYIEKLNKIENNNYKLNIKNNEVIFNPKNENNYLMNIFNIRLFDKNKNYLFYDDLYTKNNCDILLYKYLNQKLISKKDLENNILHLIKDKIDKKILEKFIKDKKIYYYKFNLIKVKMHNKIKISNIYEYKKHKFLYIGNGDTIFHSHFVTGAGLHRILTFITKVLYLINLYYK
jgi:hypothetical protein